jgi:tRNA dimethylallyltransferase
MRRAALLLMGPTGAGKSQLALRLAEALPLEIVSVDSALVYRGMDIGTAKPTLATRARVEHHLIDIRDAAMSYSAGDFVRDAAGAMEGIWARGRQPLLVGGTMMYFHALTRGIAALPEADPRVRAEIDARAQAHGWDAMHRELAQVDPAAAARIHTNDPQRIQRALEVYRLTGETISQLQQPRSSVLGGVEVFEIAVAPAQRSTLHARIELRMKAMLAAGLLEEVRTFFNRGDLSLEQASMRAVGYRQFWQHMAGDWSLEEATDRAIAATRQLAKRQWTWLRRRVHARWFDAMDPNLEGAVLGALSTSAFAEW